MSKTMDIDGNGRLDWFFNEWVYGTQVPRYHFEYKLLPADGGKVKLHMTITQSEVDEHFVMPVPIFVDFGKGMLRIGEVRIAGNSTYSGDVLLPSQPKKVALNALQRYLGAMRVANQNKGVQTLSKTRTYSRAEMFHEKVWIAGFPIRSVAVVDCGYVREKEDPRKALKIEEDRRPQGSVYEEADPEKASCPEGTL